MRHEPQRPDLRVFIENAVLDEWSATSFPKADWKVRILSKITKYPYFLSGSEEKQSRYISGRLWRGLGGSGKLLETLESSRAAENLKSSRY